MNIIGLCLSIIFLCIKLPIMVITIIAVILILLILGLLFIPMTIHIDTESGQYYMKLGTLAKASIELHETEILRIAIKVPLHRFYLYPLRPKKKG